MVSLRSVEFYFILQNYPGVVSLVTKSVFLAVAIILAHFGIHKERPFLLYCVEENSTLLNTMDNKTTLCTNLTSCFLERRVSEPSESNLTDLSVALDHLGLANSSLMHLENEAILTNRALKKIELMREMVQEVQLLADEVKEEMLNPKGLLQKVRVCGENETTIRVVTLSSLVSLLVLAALATYQLHKITDYKVGQSLTQCCVEKFKQLVSGALCNFEDYRLREHH